MSWLLKCVFTAHINIVSSLSLTPEKLNLLCLLYMKIPWNKKYLASFISLHIHDIILDIYLNYLSDDMMIDINDNL